MKGSSSYRSKRAFDVIAAAAGLVLATPVLVLAAAAIALTSRGPVVHRAQRVGRSGHMITVHKLRSMFVGRPGSLVTGSSDPRITPVGRLIRSAKLDELPQLWDVIIGSMSLVGPRPEDLAYVEHYSPAQRRILEWRPGITSPASIAYRHEEQLLDRAADFDAEYRRISADKIRVDIAYFEYATLMSDLRVIGRTLSAIVDRRPPNGVIESGTSKTE